MMINFSSSNCAELLGFRTGPLKKQPSLKFNNYNEQRDMITLYYTYTSLDSNANDAIIYANINDYSNTILLVNTV